MSSEIHLTEHPLNLCGFYFIYFINHKPLSLLVKNEVLFEGFTHKSTVFVL